MGIDSIGKMLMAMGGLFLVVELLFVLGARLGLGALPGDVAVRRGNTSFFFPVVTCILLSLGLTIVLNLLQRFWK